MAKIRRRRRHDESPFDASLPAIPKQDLAHVAELAQRASRTFRRQQGEAPSVEEPLPAEPPPEAAGEAPPAPPEEERNRQ